jgi:hypothetical protein
MAKSYATKTAIIGAAGVVLAAIITAILQPGWWQSNPNLPSKPDLSSSLVIAGTVVDQKTNQAIGQANLSVVGRSESYVSEDNGNFRIQLHAPELEGGRIIRIHVAKPGYAPYDGTVSPPSENLIIPLRPM